jgi:cytidylate kinase
MIITLSGAPGSGKSTVAEALVKKFHLTRYYMGQIRRDQAKEHHLT